MPTRLPVLALTLVGALATLASLASSPASAKMRFRTDRCFARAVGHDGYLDVVRAALAGLHGTEGVAEVAADGETVLVYGPVRVRALGSLILAIDADWTAPGAERFAPLLPKPLASRTLEGARAEKTRTATETPSPDGAPGVVLIADRVGKNDVRAWFDAASGQLTRTSFELTEISQESLGTTCTPFFTSLAPPPPVVPEPQRPGLCWLALLGAPMESPVIAAFAREIGRAPDVGTTKATVGIDWVFRWPIRTATAGQTTLVFHDRRLTQVDVRDRAKAEDPPGASWVPTELPYGLALGDTRAAVAKKLRAAPKSHGKVTVKRFSPNIDVSSGAPVAVWAYFAKGRLWRVTYIAGAVDPALVPATCDFGVEQVARGCVKGDCVGGKGTYDNGRCVYVGQWAKGERSGDGVETCGGRQTWRGPWKYDRPHGQGSYCGEDGREPCVATRMEHGERQDRYETDEQRRSREHREYLARWREEQQRSAEADRERQLREREARRVVPSARSARQLLADAVKYAEGNLGYKVVHTSCGPAAALESFTTGSVRLAAGRYGTFLIHPGDSAAYLIELLEPNEQPLRDGDRQFGAGYFSRSQKEGVGVGASFALSAAHVVRVRVSTVTPRREDVCVMVARL
ncbi:MAG: hypothetical protein H6745_29350 [Deltaproteobacteria bacterium]|nr:hypothetical protein [Deltaproteobacteria bacterium]